MKYIKTFESFSKKELEIAKSFGLKPLDELEIGDECIWLIYG